VAPADRTVRLAPFWQRGYFVRTASLLVLLVLLLSPCAAGAMSVGIGAYGGLGLPVLQADAGSGAAMGVRVPVSLFPLLTVEPYYQMIKGGQATQSIGGESFARNGPDANGFGANLLLTFGSKLQLYPYAGVGSYTLSRNNFDNESDTAYSFGFGLGFSPLAHLSLHLRTELDAAVRDEVSRKWFTTTLGVTYNRRLAP
jgi:hypothetical protein